MIDEEKSYFEDFENFIANDDEEEDVDFDQIDFSDATGNFKRSLKKGTKKALKKNKKQKPTLKEKIFIPSDRKVIIQGMDKLLMGQDEESQSIRDIGYYEGKKLDAVVFTINNDGLIDFDVELFNPSMPLDYLQSTGLNLNSKITVAGAGSDVSYTDVLNYIAANPMLIPNMRLVVAGPSDTAQRSMPIQILNKAVNGSSFLKPINVSLLVDNMQVDQNIISFDICRNLGRAYIPDGMDVMKYTVLAGNTVTFALFSKHNQLKRRVFKEARDKKIL